VWAPRGTPDRIAANAARLDLCAPAALDVFVDANHDRAIRHEGCDQRLRFVRDGSW